MSGHESQISGGAAALLMLLSWGVWGYVWWWTARRSRLSHRHWIQRHASGAFLGVVAGFSVILIAALFSVTHVGAIIGVALACGPIYNIRRWMGAEAVREETVVDPSSRKPEPVASAGQVSSHVSGQRGIDETENWLERAERLAVERVRREMRGAPRKQPQCVDATETPQALPMLLSFDYADRDGVLTRRTVMVHTVGVARGRTYLEGVCQERHAVRTFRTDRIIGTLEHVGSAETLSVAALVRAAGPLEKLDVEPPAREYHPGAPARPRQDAVLFTGFHAGRRAELEELAIAAGWDVRINVGPTLDYLVAGPNAGAAKVGKAEGDGVTVISEEMFRTMVA